MIKVLEEFKTFLKNVDIEKYSDEEVLPAIPDREIIRFIALINELRGYEQKSLVFSINTEDSTKLLIFSERMASLAVREKSLDKIICGFYALSYCFKVEDWRDVMVRICLLCHSILKLGYSPEDVLSKIKFSDLEFKKFLKDFLSRNEQDKSLKAFLYVESEEKGEFLYKNIWSVK